MVRDPVCVAQLIPEETEFISEYRGQTYYFCCAGCKAEFDADPGTFSGRLAQAAYGDIPYHKPD